MAEKYYVTTPIYYANGPAHIGGAYTTIAADVLARWNAILGRDVFFLTGTDEHGKKVQETAEKKGISPKEFVDGIVEKWKETFKLLNISNNNFIRTTDSFHEKEVKKMLQTLYDKDLIYKGEYEAYYCVGCEQYLTKSDLVDGVCPLHKREPELKREEAYMFRLSKFQDELVSLIENGKYCILPEKRRKEILQFIRGGLNDVSISRLKSSVSWGIELPFDKNHCAWVWPDAFWNYLTGLKQKNAFDEFWPPTIQLMAKDIFRVHATIWPALLLGAGIELPKKLFIHGFFTSGGQKMSKSLGNVIDPNIWVKKYGADSVRYFLMRQISFGEDGDISEDALIRRHNDELANKLGNLVSRVSVLAENNGIEETDNNLIKKLDRAKIEKLFEEIKIDKVLNEIFAFIDVCNEYIQEKKPWKTKDKKVLFELVEAIREIAKLLSPFIPETAGKINVIFSGSKIKKAPVLFEKIELEKETKQNLNKSEEPKEIMEGVTTIEYSDFEKLDMRVAEVLEVSEIEGADKLWKLDIDTGIDKRVICAGLKPYYSAKELKGRKIIVLVNLKPRKLRGIESQGMLLAASSEDHSTVSLLGVDGKAEVGDKVS